MLQPSLPAATRYILSVLPGEQRGYIPPAGTAGCPGLQHSSDYSHVVRVHSMGHIGADHVGLGHSLLEGCQVLR